MGSFSDPFWNLFIIVCTLGGIVWLYLLTIASMRARGPAATKSAEAGTTRHVWDEDLTELDNPLPRWWVILFFATLAFGVVYLMLYPGFGTNSMVLGWTQVEEYEDEMARAEARYGALFEGYLRLPVEEVAADPKALRMGERLFASYCAVCHGADAGGVPGFPNLRDAVWQWGGEPDEIRTSILDGRNAAMPGWREALGGDVGVGEVTAYVLSLSGRSVDAARAASGKEGYDALCVACHGVDGTGNPDLGGSDLTDDVWLYGGSDAAVRESIAEGRAGRMPAHGEFLGEGRVHVLAAWVYSLSRR